jgi:hypothetical protein
MIVIVLMTGVLTMAVRVRWVFMHGLMVNKNDLLRQGFSTRRAIPQIRHRRHRPYNRRLT